MFQRGAGALDRRTKTDYEYKFSVVSTRTSKNDGLAPNLMRMFCKENSNLYSFSSSYLEVFNDRVNNVVQNYSPNDYWHWN